MLKRVLFGNAAADQRNDVVYLQGMTTLGRAMPARGAGGAGGGEQNHVHLTLPLGLLLIMYISIFIRQ